MSNHRCYTGFKTRMQVKLTSLRRLHAGGDKPVNTYVAPYSAITGAPRRGKSIEGFVTRRNKITLAKVRGYSDETEE
jgi:hypothetical protein